jgi:hypothetical protein
LSRNTWAIDVITRLELESLKGSTDEGDLRLAKLLRSVRRKNQTGAAFTDEEVEALDSAREDIMDCLTC